MDMILRFTGGRLVAFFGTDRSPFPFESAGDAAAALRIWGFHPVPNSRGLWRRS
jgi:hypothetical protein